jgi:UDP-glucose 4-epimerase
LKCVIFGGGGFIGSALADRLLNDGHAIRIFERPRVAQYRSFLPHEKIEWVSGDFSNVHDLKKSVDGTDVVFHLISTSLPKNSNDDPVYDVQSNVIASLQLLRCMVECKVPRIVFISSGGTVYGNPNYLPIDEKHPTNPIVSYGITKLAIEKYLQLYERLYGLTAISLRVANPYGERQRIETAQGVIAAFLNRAMTEMPIEVWGDGSVTRDYLHISDVVEALAKASIYKGQERVFNISSGVGTSLESLINVLESVLNKKIERKYLPSRPFDVPVSILSNELARYELGWSPTISLEDGLMATIDWIKKSGM